MSNLLTIRDLDQSALETILDLSEATDHGRPLAGQGVALYFEKPSTRTRNSMEMAAVQLGAHPIYLQREELGIGSRESVEDIARTLACYHSLVAARVKDHRLLESLAGASAIPVLNLLSDSDHPLQALADLLTIRQLFGRIEGVRIAYIGDANNVARSLAEGCALLGAHLVIASPPGYGFSSCPPGVGQTEDPVEAARSAQVIYTDVWVSMGQDSEADQRAAAFAPYRVDERLMAYGDNPHFFHCLPARRGEEVTPEVIDGSRSAVWRQAENRMHTARGAMLWMNLGD